MGEYIFDTNCFYQISVLEKNIINNNNNKYFCSLVQYNEIKNKEITTYFSKERKQRLLETYKMIEQKELPTESFILGDPSASFLGKSKLGTTGLFFKIKDDLNKLKNHKGNHNDGLIAEIAIKNNLILVTNDQDLCRITKKYYSDVITLAEFKKVYVKCDY